MKPQKWWKGGIALTVMAFALGLGMPSAMANEKDQASTAGAIAPTAPDLRTSGSLTQPALDINVVEPPAPSLHTQVFYGDLNGFTDYDIGTSSTAPSSITSLQGTNLKNDTGILGTSARGSTQQTLTDTGPPALITTNGGYLANVPPLKYLKEPRIAGTNTDITGAGQTTHSTTSVFSPLITIDNTHLLAGGAANHWTGVQ